jgi:hypothetical protein
LLVKHTDTVRYITAQRIRWVGHIVRMNIERREKRITGCSNTCCKKDWFTEVKMTGLYGSESGNKEDTQLE